MLSSLLRDSVYGILVVICLPFSDIFLYLPFSYSFFISFFSSDNYLYLFQRCSCNFFFVIFIIFVFFFFTTVLIVTISRQFSQSFFVFLIISITFLQIDKKKNFMYFLMSHIVFSNQNFSLQLWLHLYSLTKNQFYNNSL